MFLLLMEGIAKHLIGVRETHFNFTAGQQAVLHLATQSNLSKLPTTCLMTTPSGQPVSLTPDSVLRQIVVPTVDELGNYRIRSGGAQETLNTGISVNLPAGITHLQRMDEARLNAVLGEGNFKWVRSPQEIEQGIARRRVGQELFPMLMLILAAFWATEYVFSNRFYAKTIGTKEEHAI